MDRPDPVDITLWTSKGEIQTWHRCICIKYDHYKGTRKFKLLDSNQIRQTRECCIFHLNSISEPRTKIMGYASPLSLSPVQA